MDSLDPGAASQDDLGLRSVESLEDLGDSLRRLRRRFARRQRDALLSYRYLAEKTGYAHGVIGGYFSGKVLPPPDKLDVLIELLGVGPAERRAFARVRDAIEERRRRPGLAPPPQRPERKPQAEPGTARPSPENAAASGFLYELLTRSGKYRALWRAKLVPGGGAHAAIADVIAEHLAARAPAEPRQDSERLLRRVTRALARGGPETALSGTVLEWFIGAFAIEREDAERLRFLFTGSSSIRYVRGDAEETKLPVFNQPEARHRTIDLREYHYLGPDGLPAVHRTDQIVEAVVDGLDRIPYLADTGMLTVDVQNGGIPSPLYQVRASDGNVYYALDILLDRPLLRGDTAVLNYTTTFSYAEPPETLVRRGFRRKVDSFLLLVRFHPEMVPTSLWWAEWDGVTGGRITHREKVELSPEFEAHRFLQGGAAQAVVGFYWDW